MSYSQSNCTPRSKKTLRVLQLASFLGNVGDNANHSGTRCLLARNLDFNLEFESLEIREFYWKERKFDDAFIDLVNQHDLFIVGGGNYFELWVDSSETGTSIDISETMFRKIKIPIIFYALGVDIGQGYTEKSVQRFRNFMDLLNSSDRVLISVRNDGAMKNLKEIVGSAYAEKVYQVPDGGFFVQTDPARTIDLDVSKKYIGINLANDMIEHRFRSKDLTAEQGVGAFLSQFANALSRVLTEKPGINLIFFCHIYKDLDMLPKLFVKFDDQLIRRRIMIAPQIQGDLGKDYTFNLYKQCEVVVGNRFHANVCPIGLGIPTIGLVNYPQIENLYHELGLAERVIRINEKDFHDNLLRLLLSSIDNKSSIVNNYAIICQRLLSDINQFHGKINHWLHRFY